MQILFRTEDKDSGDVKDEDSNANTTDKLKIRLRIV